MRHGRNDKAAPVVINDVKKLIVLLSKAVEPHPRIVAPLDPGDIRLAASVFRGAVLRRGAGDVIRIAPVVGAVVVKERRDRQHQALAKSANPGESGKRIVLAIDVPQKRGRIAGINRHLIKIAPRLSDQPKLVLRIQIENERGKSAEPVSRIVNNSGSGSLQPEVSAAGADARVISEAIGMAAEIELIVSLIEISGGEHKFGFIVAFESCTR